MKPRALGVLVLAACAGAACQAGMVGEPAPALEGAGWTSAESEGVDAPETEGRWTVLAFFAPT